MTTVTTLCAQCAKPVKCAPHCLPSLFNLWSFVLVLLPALPDTSTSAAHAPLCSPGRMRASWAAPSFYVSKIPIWNVPRRNRCRRFWTGCPGSVSYTHLRAHETRHDLVCRLLLEKKKNKD